MYNPEKQAKAWQVCQRVDKNGPKLPFPISLWFIFNHKMVAFQISYLTLQVEFQLKQFFWRCPFLQDSWDFNTYDPVLCSKVTFEGNTFYCPAQAKPMSPPWDFNGSYRSVWCTVFVPPSQHPTQHLLYWNAEQWMFQSSAGTQRGQKVSGRWQWEALSAALYPKKMHMQLLRALQVSNLQ